MKRIKKRPIWVRKEDYNNVKDILSNSGISSWTETEVFYLHLLTVVLTSIIWIGVIIAIALLQ